MVFDNQKVDLMPDDETILGFSNRWYQYGYDNRIKVFIDKVISIYIFPLPVYLATKLEAITNRGMDDIRLSHDFEDVIFLIGNCSRIELEIDQSQLMLKNYIAEVFRTLQKLANFKEAVLWSLSYGSDDSEVKRITEITDRIAKWSPK